MTFTLYLFLLHVNLTFIMYFTLMSYLLHFTVNIILMLI